MEISASHVKSITVSHANNKTCVVFVTQDILFKLMDHVYSAMLPTVLSAEIPTTAVPVLLDTLPIALDNVSTAMLHA